MTGFVIDEPAHPRVGVGVLLVDERGRVLLTLRNRPPEADCWSIVGGKLDFLEPLEQCAIREALEEVGVEIAIDRLLCVTDHHLLPTEAQHTGSPPRTSPAHCAAKPPIASPTRPAKSVGSPSTAYRPI